MLHFKLLNLLREITLTLMTILQTPPLPLLVFMKVMSMKMRKPHLLNLKEQTHPVDLILRLKIPLNLCENLPEYEELLTNAETL